jgi:hypothetical protein
MHCAHCGHADAFDATMCPRCRYQYTYQERQWQSSQRALYAPKKSRMGCFAAIGVATVSVVVIGLVVVGGGAWWLSEVESPSSSRKQKGWTSIAYADKHDLRKYQTFGPYDSLAVCQASGLALLRGMEEKRCSSCNRDASSRDPNCSACDDPPLAVGAFDCGSDCDLLQAVPVCDRLERYR